MLARLEATLEARLDQLRHQVTEARDYAKAANDKATEARDSSVKNHTILQEVVRPQLKTIEAEQAAQADTVLLHQGALDKGRGALWAFGIVGVIITILLGILPFVVR